MTESPTESSTRLVLRPTPEGIRDAYHWLDSVHIEQGLTKSLVSRLDICLHEALANVIAHGGRGASDAEVEVEFGIFREHGRKEVVLTVTDGGIAFDPTRAMPHKRQVSLGDAEPGGLGLHMMREAADRIMYSRQSGRNRLTFVFVWDQTGN